MTTIEDNRTIYQLQDDIRHYEQRRIRISKDIMSTKTVLYESMRKALPTAELAPLINRFIEDLDAHSDTMRLRIKAKTDHIHLQIAERIKDEQRTLV